MSLPTALLPSLLAVLLIDGHVAVQAASDETTSIFSLAEVIAPVRDFPASLQAGELSAHPAPSPPASDQQQLEAFVRRCFEPGMVDLILAHSTYHQELLSVTGSTALIDHVEDVVKRLRAERNTNIHTRLEVVMMDPKLRQQQYALPELAWKDLPGHLGLAYAPLTRAQHAALEARWSHQAGLSFPSGPSLTAFSGQLANCSFKTIYEYPKLEFPASGPAVGTGYLTYGFTLQLRATATDDHRFIQLFMAYDTSSLLQVTSVAVGVKPDGSTVTIEEPQLWTTHEQVDQAIEDKASLILTTGLFLEKDQPPRAGFLIVTPEVLDLTAPGPSPDPRMKEILIPHDAQPEPGAPAPQATH